MLCADSHVDELALEQQSLVLMQEHVGSQWPSPPPGPAVANVFDEDVLRIKLDTPNSPHHGSGEMSSDFFDMGDTETHRDSDAFGTFCQELSGPLSNA